jgi:vacuolar protein sorting-associated protein 13A/C
MKVQLSSPIEIENLLPFDITYRIVDKDSGQDFSSELEKSGRSPLHIIDLDHLLLMAIDVHDTGMLVHRITLNSKQKVTQSP